MHAQEERVPLLEPSPSQSPDDPSTSNLKKPSTLRTVCPYILGNELCERFAYNGLATNLVTYITRVMGGEPAFAAIMVAVFEGTCYNTPIIGALLADSVWGRYKTIMVFSFIYLVGIVLLTLSSMIPDAEEDAETANPLQYGVLFGALAVISLGTGGIKPNVSAFGADQFNEADPQDRKEKESFFNWFYLAINVGSLLAGTVIVYIQDSISWTLGFAIPGVAMALAIMLFWAGRGGYRHVMPTESPMARVAKVVWAAIKNKYAKKGTPDSTTHQQYVVPSASSPPDTSSYHGAQLYRQAMQNNMFNNGTDTNGVGNGRMNGQGMLRADSMHQMPMTNSMSYRWLEDAVTEWRTSQGQLVTTGGLAGYTPKQVEEVKLVIRLLPIFGTTVLYWTVYTQMGTLFVQQGNLMGRHYDWGGQTFKVPSASMSVFNTLSVILLVWWYDAWLEPVLKKSPRFKMTLLRRQGWGMLIAAIAMVYAGGLEAWRLSTLASIPPCPTTVTCNATPPDGYKTFDGSLAGPFGGMGSTTRQLLYSAGSAGSALAPLGLTSAADMLGRPEACLCPNDPSPLSIFWQAPAYFLIGLSEVFTSIGQLEFFYDQAPDVMRSCSMALCLLSTAIGSYLAGALTYAVQKFSMMVTGCEWLPRDLNRGHIDFFFYSLAVVMMANLGAFLYVAMRYQYKVVEHKRHVLQPAAQQQPVAATGPAVPARSQASAPAQLLSAAWQVPGPHTAPMAIGRPGMVPPPPDLDAAGLEIYSRSLAYVPPSPNIPAPFR